jgi:hypothetical protein
MLYMYHLTVISTLQADDVKSPFDVDDLTTTFLKVWMEKIDIYCILEM